MRKYIVAIILSMSLLAGCGFLASAVPWIAKITAVVVDASNVLSTINDVANKYFVINDTPARTRDEFNTVMVKARLMLQAANSSLRGADNLTQQQFDDAFARFNDAYKELVALCATTGVTQRKGAYGVAKLPEPMSLSYKVAD